MYLIAILVVALVIAGLVYDRGKKCGAWEAEFEEVTTTYARSQKPLVCWHLN